MPRIFASMGALLLTASCGLSSVSSVETPQAATQPPPVNDANSGTTTGTAQDTNTAATPSIVTLSGSMFTPHIGQQLGAALIDANQNIVATATTTVDSGGNFTVVFTDNPVAGDGYTVQYYADLNKNKFCNAPPVDHSWVTTVPAVTAATTVDVVHSMDFMPVCEAFGAHSMTFNGINFNGHAGETFFLTINDGADNSQVGQVLSGTIPNSGNVTFGWPTLLLSDHTYVVAYFADVNNNGACDTVDHQWMQKLPAVTNDVTLQGDHNSPQMQICKYFPTGKLN